MFSKTVSGKAQAAFTLGELLLCVVIVMVLAAILFPVFARPRGGSRNLSCLSNEKQIGLGFLQYVQDYDEIMPPARKSGGVEAEDAFPDDSWENVIFPYVKSTQLFHCPDVPMDDTKHSQPSYRLSDLVPEAKLENISSSAYTILAMDGDLTTNDVGHAWTPNDAPHPAHFDQNGNLLPGLGATVQNAPLRHQGGAIYTFADGHVKYLHPNQVFFPPRASASRSHKDADGIVIGPDPAGSMMFAGAKYEATFHLR